VFLCALCGGALGQRASGCRPYFRAVAGVDTPDFTTLIVTLDGYCFEWCTLLFATTPFDSL
jgi:hypothetical protein